MLGLYLFSIVLAALLYLLNFLGWLIQHGIEICIALFLFSIVIHWIIERTSNTESYSKSESDSTEEQLYFETKKLENYLPNEDTSNLIIDNEIEEIYEESMYCDVCGAEISEEEYAGNGGVCDECYADVNVHYQEYGMDDYTSLYEDIIDVKDNQNK